ncbi:MAG: hypothetical protein U5K71_15765 [Gracilimonas sp.]|nr:hypothetical protein [Gracilimonas sp.]
MLILEGKGRDPQSELEAQGFETWMEGFSSSASSTIRNIELSIGEKCKKCEYQYSPNALAE